ncbi:MAG: hypothetical protein LAQ30_17950 [Acidobacteriia bacterium]|nr:hypothetical protein [Terriglobia bacterium]
MTVQEREEKTALNTPGGEEVMAKLGGKDAGLPFFAFLDAKGDAIVNSMRPVAGKPKPTNIGHPAQPEEVDWFMVMVKKAAPAISPEEAKVLEDWLRNQKK